jgi:hypothetical protein
MVAVGSWMLVPPEAQVETIGTGAFWAQIVTHGSVIQDVEQDDAWQCATVVGVERVR